ncbi:MAG: adenylyltransferase/cytidyltransferase family protein [Mollicutes bacterium PWAP]|nr:adenylyltransferase/cytidyltransferase family protein [Mollicutes bacterium PWAP]
MKKTAVILGRFQPIHKGHIEMIKYAKEKYKEVYIFVGKSKETSRRNSYDVKQMRELVIKFSKIKADNVSILPDLTHEGDDSGDWTLYLIDNMVKTTGGHNYVFLGGEKDKYRNRHWFKDTNIELDFFPDFKEFSSTKLRALYNQIKEMSPIFDVLKERELDDEI